MSDRLRTVSRTFIGFGLLAISVWFVAGFPILRVPLAVGLALYALCLWRQPRLWLVAVPALLPILDLAPLSGRFFFDEFDALVLVTASVLLLKENGESLPPLPRVSVMILGLLALSYAASTALRLVPLPPITPDSFANYYSPYNALRVAKGFVWALLLLRPLRQAMDRYPDARFLLCLGFVLGLVGICAAAVYERFLFPGLFDWTSDYRVTSMFSSMHTGDGPIDLWLDTTIPLLGILLIAPNWRRLLPLTIAAGGLALYTLLATTSRGPIIAAALAYVVGLFALWATRKGRFRAVAATIVGFSAVVLISTVGVPALAQTALGQRFAQAREDAAFRFQHWSAALGLRDDTVVARVFGMGLGVYPLLHQERSTAEPHAAHYQYMDDGASRFIRLWSGKNLYVGQEISIKPGSDYQLSIRVRTAETNASLSVAWCDLWMLYSNNCTGKEFALTASPGQWQMLAGTIHSDVTGSPRPLGGLAFTPPTRFTFFVSNAMAGGVDVGAVSVTRAGDELVRNGDFQQGADHWFFAVDTDLPWHPLNSVVYLLIEQGWLGLIAVSALLVLTFATLARQIAAGDALSALMLASLVGFMVGGVTVSTFDQPRLALMFYLLCLAALSTGHRRSRGT
jgi:hypothetical protein